MKNEGGRAFIISLPESKESCGLLCHNVSVGPKSYSKFENVSNSKGTSCRNRCIWHFFEQLMQGPTNFHFSPKDASLRSLVWAKDRVNVFMKCIEDLGNSHDTVHPQSPCQRSLESVANCEWEQAVALVVKRSKKSSVDQNHQNHILAHTELCAYPPNPSEKSAFPRSRCVKTGQFWPGGWKIITLQFFASKLASNSWKAANSHPP